MKTLHLLQKWQLCVLCNKWKGCICCKNENTAFFVQMKTLHSLNKFKKNCVLCNKWEHYFLSNNWKHCILCNLWMLHLLQQIKSLFLATNRNATFVATNENAAFFATNENAAFFATNDTLLTLNQPENLRLCMYSILSKQKYSYLTVQSSLRWQPCGWWRSW